MAEQQQNRADLVGAWAQSMEGVTNTVTQLADQTMRWQQDLVHLWVDTQQQLVGFWMRTQEQTAEQTAQAGQAWAESGEGAAKAP